MATWKSWLPVPLLLICAAAGLGMWRRGEPADLSPPSSAAPTPHEVRIRQSPRSPGVRTNQTDFHGKPIAIECAVCHAGRAANTATHLSSDLDIFHQGLRMQHGNLTCASCHNPADGYRSLRLADGRSVPFTDTMQLCAQCHGPQYRDYQHGAHGGMTGYWDLTRGPRERNTCLACHDAHAPKIQPVRPAPGPRDRFRPRPGEASHD